MDRSKRSMRRSSISFLITCKMAVPPELPRIYTWFRFFNRLFAELPLVKSNQWVRMGEIEKKEI